MRSSAPASARAGLRRPLTSDAAGWSANEAFRLSSNDLAYIIEDCLAWLSLISALPAANAVLEQTLASCYMNYEESEEIGHHQTV